MEYRVIYEHRAWQCYDETLESYVTLEEAVRHLVDVYNTDAKLAFLDAPDVALLVFKDGVEVYRFGFPYSKPDNVTVLDYVRKQLESSLGI